MTIPGGPFDQAVAAELAKLKQDVRDIADDLCALILEPLRGVSTFWEAMNVDARSGPITLDMMEAAAFQGFAEYWEPESQKPQLLIQPSWIGPDRPLSPMKRMLSPWMALWRFES